MKNSDKFFHLSLFIVAATASALLLWATGIYGIGVSPDSTVYIDTAINLMTGNGFIAYNEPMTHYPPIYPVILAISGIMNTNIIHSARWLHATIFGINTILYGLVISRSTHGNRIAMFLSLLLFVSSSQILQNHSYAWSESPFIMFTLLSFLLLFNYISSNQMKYLIISSISLGLATGTRYVGLSLLPPIILVLILFVDHSIKNKIKILLTYISLSLVPILIWIIRNIFTIQSSTDRSMVYHPIGIREIFIFIFSFHGYIQENINSLWADNINLFVILCIFLFLLWVIIKNRPPQGKSYPLDQFFIILGTLSFASYILFIFFSISFFDAHLPLDQRIYFPAYLFITIAIFSAIFNYINFEKKKMLWILLMVYLIFSIVTNFTPMVDWIRESRSYGINYNSRIWRKSPIISSLKQIDPKVKIYSNGRDVISFRTNLISNNLPKSKNPNTLIQNTFYLDEIKSICEEVAVGDAIIVYFDNIKRWYFPTKIELEQNCHMPVLLNEVDGIIYGLSRK